MRKYIWVIESSYKGGEWYPLVDFVARTRKMAMNIMKNSFYHLNDCKYRVGKYERLN